MYYFIITGSFSTILPLSFKLIQMTDVVVQHPKEVIPSDHQQLLSEVEIICR